MSPSLVSPTAQWALLYAKAGWRSFPVWPGEKRPIYAGWQSGASTDREMLTRYFSDTDRNIGVVTGEVFEAWDIEAPHVEAFFAFIAKHGTLPESPLATTGRGGIHVLMTPIVGHTRKLYLDGTHIGEIKSTGGFIVVAPSETEAQYHWRYLPERLAVQAPPDWLQGLLERPQGTKRLPAPMSTPDDVVTVLGRLAGSVEHAPEGTRNNYLYWAMRRAVEEGVPVRHAAKVLHGAGIEAGLPLDEVETTIRSALDAESVAA
jgi:hypothetical protein